jgi:hypothetical protein
LRPSVIFRRLFRRATLQAWKGLVDDATLEEVAKQLAALQITEWAAFKGLVRPYLPRLFPYSAAELQILDRVQREALRLDREHRERDSPSSDKVQSGQSKTG